MWNKVEDFPDGYPRLAAFVASEQKMMQFRGFRMIRTRLLLHLQTDIQRLDTELNRLDEG
jgi:hypothetical protein